MPEYSLREMRATDGTQYLEATSGTDAHRKLTLDAHPQRLGVPLIFLLDVTRHPSGLFSRDGLKKRSRVFVLFQLIDQILNVIGWTI
jgi:hypothetical protein